MTKKELNWNTPPRKCNRKGDYKSTQIQNKRLRTIISMDFLENVRQQENGYFIKSKLLISPSMLMYSISRKALSPIPPHILEKRKQLGINLMNNLQAIFDNKIYDTTEIVMSEQDRKLLNGFLDFLQDNNIKILSVEKFITNNSFCGFVDMLVMWNGCICVLELKARNKKELRITDYIQTVIYKKILGRAIPTFVVMIDDDGKVDYVRITDHRAIPEYKKFLNFMKFWKEFGVIDDTEITPIEISDTI